MADLNPYQSPASTEPHPSSTPEVDRRAWGMFLACVSLHFVVSGWTLFVNRAQIDVAVVIVGTPLWFLLPLLAFALIWRGRMTGFWILVTLFGLRGVGELVLAISLSVYAGEMAFRPTVGSAKRPHFSSIPRCRRMVGGLSQSPPHHQAAAVHLNQRLPRSGVLFEPMSKRRRGFPSEAQVKRGLRIVHGDKELVEKLGRNDLCPCGSGTRFKRCCLRGGRF